MYGLLQLATLAFATVAVAHHPHHVQVTFERFADQNCSRLIQKNTHLDNGKCKTFDHHELAFKSFSVAKVDKHEGHLRDWDCQAIAHKEPDCKGEGFTNADFINALGQCGNNDLDAQFAARSVMIKCHKRQAHIVTDAAPPHVVSTVTALPAAKVTVDQAAKFETVTLYQAPAHHDDHCCDNYD